MLLILFLKPLNGIIERRWLSLGECFLFNNFSSLDMRLKALSRFIQLGADFPALREEPVDVWAKPPGIRSQ
jgi:hypothetical protein